MNDVVVDHPESDPALDAVRSFVERSPQPMAAFENTDTAFTACAPLLKLLKPTLLLPLFACGTLRVVAWNRKIWPTPISPALDSLAAEKKPGSATTRSGARPELFDMLLQTSSQQCGVSRPLFAYLVMRNDLVLRLLNQDQFAKLIGLMRLTLADHLGVRLEYAEQLSFGFGVAAPAPAPVSGAAPAGPGESFSSSCLPALRRTDRLPRLTPPTISRENFQALPRNPAGDFQQFDVRVLHLLAALAPSCCGWREAIAKTFSFAPGSAAIAHLRAGPFPATAVTLFMMRVRTRTPLTQ